MNARTKSRSKRAASVGATSEAAAVDPAALAGLRGRLVDWYRGAARDLPWRKTRDPYAIWVSEVMLQQTRVETVLPYFDRFLQRFPDVRSLADASVDEVLTQWSGLGYYRRARLLHRGAQHVRDVHRGEVPDDPDAIGEIPGVGAYTRGAIASFAFGRQEALVDGNVARVLARLFTIEDDVKKGRGHARAWSLARALVVGPHPALLNNALMELGATVCVPREPRCPRCPLQADCRARSEGREKSLPIVTEKTAQPEVHSVAAVIALPGGVLLARRAGDGLFGGLWEPPRVESEQPSAANARARARSTIAAWLGVEVELHGRAKIVEHLLTHRRLVVRVHRATLGAVPRAIAPESGYDALAVVPLDALGERGLSTLARRVLEAVDARAERAAAADAAQRA